MLIFGTKKKNFQNATQFGKRQWDVATGLKRLNFLTAGLCSVGRRRLLWITLWIALLIPALSSVRVRRWHPLLRRIHIYFKKVKKVKTLKIYYSQLTYSAGVSLYQLFYVCLLVGTIDWLALRSSGLPSRPKKFNCQFGNKQFLSLNLEKENCIFVYFKSAKILER